MPCEMSTIQTTEGGLYRGGLDNDLLPEYIGKEVVPVTPAKLTDVARRLLPEDVQRRILQSQAHTSLDFHTYSARGWYVERAKRLVHWTHKAAILHEGRFQPKVDIYAYMESHEYESEDSMGTRSQTWMVYSVRLYYTGADWVELLWTLKPDEAEALAEKYEEPAKATTLAREKVKEGLEKLAWNLSMARKVRAEWSEPPAYTPRQHEPMAEGMKEQVEEDLAKLEKALHAAPHPQV